MLRCSVCVMFRTPSTMLTHSCIARFRGIRERCCGINISAKRRDSRARYGICEAFEEVSVLICGVMQLEPTNRTLAASQQAHRNLFLIVLDKQGLRFAADLPTVLQEVEDVTDIAIRYACLAHVKAALRDRLLDF